MLLQETVRRECGEREELTAALSLAQQGLHGQRSMASQHRSSRSPADPVERQAPPGDKNFYRQSQPRVPLTRSAASPNTFQPTDKTRGLGTQRGGAEMGLGSKSRGGGLNGGRRREVMLPRLKTSCSESEVKQKVSLMMGRE